MKKRCLLLTLAAIFSLGLAGCKSNSKTSDTEIVSSSEPVEPSEPSESSEPEEPIPAEFPLAEVKAFYSEIDVDVENLPAYASTDIATTYEVETDDVAITVYANYPTAGTVAADIASYVEALTAEEVGFAITGHEEESPNDYFLAREDGVTVSIADFDEYVGLAFSYTEPAPEAKTAESVSTDINTIFNALVGTDIMSWYSQYNCYIGGLNLGAAKATTDEEHQAELKNATEFVASYLPEYLTTDFAEFEESEDDYYIGLSVDEVGVDLFGYLNSSSNIIVQIQVSDLVK